MQPWSVARSTKPTLPTMLKMPTRSCHVPCSMLRQRAGKSRWGILPPRPCSGCYSRSRKTGSIGKNGGEGMRNVQKNKNESKDQDEIGLEHQTELFFPFPSPGCSDNVLSRRRAVAVSNRHMVHVCKLVARIAKHFRADVPFFCRLFGALLTLR